MPYALCPILYTLYSVGNSDTNRLALPQDATHTHTHTPVTYTPHLIREESGVSREELTDKQFVDRLRANSRVFLQHTASGDVGHADTSNRG